MFSWKYMPKVKTNTEATEDTIYVYIKFQSDWTVFQSFFCIFRSASAHESSCNPASHCSFPNHQTFYLLPKFGSTAHCCRRGGWRAQLSYRKVHAVTWDEPAGGAAMMGHIALFHTFSAIAWAMRFPHKRKGQLEQTGRLYSHCMYSSRLPQLVVVYVGQCLCNEKAATSKVSRETREYYRFHCSRSLKWRDYACLPYV